MISKKLDIVRRKAGEAYETAVTMLIVTVLCGGLLVWLILMGRVLQPVFSPIVTFVLAVTVIVYASRAGWFTATIMWAGVVAYVGSFMIAPAVSMYAAQAICGTGIILALIAGFRAFTPPQKRCLTAA